MKKKKKKKPSKNLRLKFSEVLPFIARLTFLLAPLETGLKEDFKHVELAWALWMI